MMEASVLLFLTCTLLFHGNSIEVAGGVAINCGSKWNSTALDGREWTGDSASVSISGQSTSSVVVATSFLGADPVPYCPYMTSRISSSPFHFTFHLSPGQKFIRLHFYRALYQGFEKSLDLFTVKAGPFILLTDFSPTHVSGSQYIVREFCLNVEQHGKLRITFSPSKSHMAYAFVNGIEIVSMPTGLYYSPDGDTGASVVGQKNRFYGIDNYTALEMVQRLNVGGSFISSVEDFGLFRRWNADTGFFLESEACIVNYRAPQVATHTNLPGPLLTAPPKVFQTSWKIVSAAEKVKSFTWKIPITLGFGYLVRLHFCDLDAAVTGGEQEEFSILIDNQIAEMHANLMRWSGGTGFPVYKDYVVTIKGDEEGSERDLIIVLQSVNGLSLGFLKAVEIFRLSNLQNSLTTSSSNHALLKKVSTNWNLKVRRSFLSLLSQSNVIGTGMLVIIVIVNTAVYCLRIISEENSWNNVNDAAAGPSNRRFSLADIRSATQDFSDAFVIGRGGFGKVYKGLIYGFPEIVAIKRLSSFSRQGAREFWAEIETLSKLRHFNLVSLIGYCDEDEEMILVYEYVSGGTLAENLYKFARNRKECTILSWEHRLRICIGTARGLEYLHTGIAMGIIHRDVKDSNILLDDKFMAKISDFGLSKLIEPSQSQSFISTKIKGTLGYLDPYYCSTGRLTRKSDVYSFGIVMLVVLSGRPALDSANPGEPSLLSCFQECLSKEEFDRIVDANIYNSISPGSLKEFATCVKSCLLQHPQKRPTMAQLVASLQQALQLQQKPIIEAHPFEHFELETIQTAVTSQGPVATLEETVVSAPMKEITKKKLPNRIRKPFWIWPWKIGSSRADGGSTLKSTDSASAAEGAQGHTADGGSTLKSTDSASAAEGAQGLTGITVDKSVKFSYEELATATDDFSVANKIGQGGFGAVYYAELRGEKAAIKKMDMQARREFLAELKVLTHLYHLNLVRLIGYCVEGSLFLVYEFIENGNLSEHLRGSVNPLSWTTRVQIALDSARGLEYIHEHTVPVYIHRDIKSANILIDKNFHAKVADFGLTKLTEVGSSSLPTRLVGTFGYMPPEYAQYGDVSPKVDVYAFGVVIYELISAKEAIVKGSSVAESKGLVGLFEEVLSQPDPEEGLRNLVDPRLGDGYSLESVRKLAQLARACTHENPQLRPTMRSIVVALMTLSSTTEDWDVGSFYGNQGLVNLMSGR